MCGIYGKVSLNNSDIDIDLMRVIGNALRHRGPDDEGIYIKENKGLGSGVNLALGHRRLSIIDLSQSGHQPMCNEDKTVWIVLNGEIYNFIELRQGLEKKGHKFKSRTDTEVVLHLYEDMGMDCFKELRGMFAFAIWDEKSERLFLVRDRLGKKPLFYSFKNGNLVFASEINALLQDVNISRAVDLASIDDFLNYQYIPAPYTIFKDIKKLPPANYLVWAKGNIDVQRYWQLDYSKKIYLKEEEYCETISDLLQESVKLRLLSDVPLGAFLSGGIDSSAIVATMAGLMDKPVKTFSIGFEEDTFNEIPYARVIAEKFATQHREFIVKPDLLEVLPKLITHFGEPYGDSSAIPTYYLCKMTRQDVTVALNGDGGDESFGGYERYKANVIAQRYKIPCMVFNALFGRIIGNIPETTDKKDAINRLKRFLRGSGLDSKNRYSEFMAIFNEHQRLEIYSETMQAVIRQNGRFNIIKEQYSNSSSTDSVDFMLFSDFMTYMPGDLLPKVDITSMANSLEARSPFLDHKFLEFGAKIPSNLKIKGFANKYILKKALKGKIPDEILNREKMGFGVPVGKWFKNEFKQYIYGILFSEKHIKRGHFKKDAIKRILDEHCNGRVNNGAKIWNLLNLELWHRIFIDKEKI